MPTAPVLALVLAAGCGGEDGGGERGPEHGPDPQRSLAARAPALAPALPPTEVANAVPDEPLTPTDAFRLVEQTTFGPRLDDIDTAIRLGAEGWIDAQMVQPATYLLAGLARSAHPDRWNEYVNVWWRHAVQSDDQLRQRVAFALSEIFVVSGADGLGQHQPGLAAYYDILLRHAFGNYRELIEEITLSPVMGEYLSAKGNRKPDPASNIRPDENYARELLQLFSIGPVRLNADGMPVTGADGVPLPSYDQSVVEGFAHVFTGWHFANAESFRSPESEDYISPMRPWPAFHDEGAKRLLGGVVLPPGQTPEADLEAALDNVFDVAAVFDRNAGGERGSLGSTLKAILMHREARTGHLDAPETFGKAKEPLLRVTQLWRAFEPERIHADFHYGWADQDLEQVPLGASSVFNFFRPDFSQPGAIGERGLMSPEFGIIDESSVIRLTTRLLANALWSHNYRADLGSRNVTIDITLARAADGVPGDGVPGDGNGGGGGGGGGGYRALVCLYLEGGCDGFSLLVPTGDAEHAAYERARGQLALARDRLLALPVATGGGVSMGLHPSAAALGPLYADGRLAMIANVGTLIEPTTREQYENAAVALPAQLFSHADQAIQWQQLQGRDRAADGWGALAVDRLLREHPQREHLTSISLAGTNYWQSGEGRRPFSMKEDGVPSYTGLDASSAWQRPRRESFRRVLEHERRHVFSSAYAELQKRAMAYTGELGEALEREAGRVAEPPPDNALAARLAMAARLVAARESLGMSRQIFYVRMTGFDVHDAQNKALPPLFGELGDALAWFQGALDGLGEGDSVTTFTASDFGRTLTSNGDGTDHGWGNHLMAMGGAVRGGLIYGTPPLLDVDGPDTVHHGRVLPTLAATQYAATLLRWLGLGDAQLGTVLPTLGNFARRDLGFLA